MPSGRSTNQPGHHVGSIPVSRKTLPLSVADVLFGIEGQSFVQLPHAAFAVRYAASKCANRRSIFRTERGR